MARQVLPIVGAVVGAYFGGPQGAQIGYAIGSLVGNAVDPLVVKGPSIGDSRVQTSAEVWRPIYFGTACGAGNIIMAGPDIKRTIEHEQGKGGGPITEEERVYKTFAIGIGDGWKGAIVGLSRIWENERLVYDIRPGSTMVAESAKFAQQFKLYLGTEDQLPDDELEAIPAQFGGGAGNVPAFRGLAYIRFARKDITTWMSIPQYRFEVVTEGAALPAVGTILLRGVGTNAAYWKSSPDGIDWSAPWVQSSNLRVSTRLLSSQTAYIADNNALAPAYMDDPANNFQSGTGATQSTTGGAKIGDYSNDYNRLLIPRGLGGGLLSSYDDDHDWHHIFPGMTSNLIVWHGISQLWYSYSLYNRLLTYTQQGSPVWSVPFDSGIATLTLCACGRGPTVLIGGQNPDLDEPRIAEVAFTTVTYPPLATTTGTSIAFVRNGSNVHIGNIDVAVLPTGEILYRPDGGASFLKSSFTFPSTPSGLAFNGHVFIISGGAASVDDFGYVYTSEDGESWVERYSEALGSDSFADLASLAISGGEVTSGPIDLAESVLRIHELAGQDLSKVNASDLAGRELGGFILAGEYSGQAAIDMLGSIFMFVSPEYDKQIHHRFRGKPIVATITDDDLVDEPDEGLREDQIEFPKKLHLEAQNTASGYAPAKETSERESSDVRVVGELSVSAPVMFAGDADAQSGEQARTTSILHKVSWENARGEREIVISDRFLGLVPGDCILLNIRNRSDRMMIVQENYVDGVLRLRLRYDRASAYVSNRSGNTPSEQTPPPSTIVGDTSFMVLDIPALVDAEDTNTALRHIAMGPQTSSWYGAEAQDSTNGGTSYSRIARVGRSGAVMGTLTADVTQASEHYTDNTNKARVQLDLASYSERVQALTEQEFLSEGGAFALRNADGEVEILQYMEVDDLGDGLIELSVLMRGRLNTGTFVFPAGSRFVLLSSVTVATIPSALIGQTIPHRAISYGETSEVSTADTLTFEGNSAKEWSVANVLLSRVSDTINVTIVPRHRFGTELSPIRSINWQAYLVEFRDSLDQIETVSTTSDTLSFDASALTFPVEVTVRQTNRFPWGTSDPVTEEIA